MRKVPTTNPVKCFLANSIKLWKTEAGVNLSPLAVEKNDTEKNGNTFSVKFRNISLFRHQLLWQPNNMPISDTCLSAKSIRNR